MLLIVGVGAAAGLVTGATLTAGMDAKISTNVLLQAPTHVMATARISQEISSASALMGTMEMLLFQMDAKT